MFSLDTDKLECRFRLQKTNEGFFEVTLFVTDKNTIGCRGETLDSALERFRRLVINHSTLQHSTPMPSCDSARDSLTSQEKGLLPALNLAIQQ